MRENRRIVLFTRRFPYFKTEAFLESEIEILAREFAEVLIIPAEISGESRNLPSNVKIDCNFAPIFSNKRKRLLNTLFSFFFIYSVFLHRHMIKNLGSIKHLFRFCSSVLSYRSFLKNYSFKAGDILYSYWFAECTKALVDLKKDRTIKVISRAHRYDIYEGLPDTPLFWPFRRSVLQKIDRVFSISENGKAFLESRYGVLDKIIVSKLGVFDKGKIAPNPRQDEINFVSVSRIDPMKRVQLIADSIVSFAREHTDTKVSWTHFGDGSRRLEIKNSIPALNNLSIYMDGIVPNKKVYEYYESSSVSIFLNLSSSEGIPVSIMEAQSFGIPVIATDVGGNAEIIDDKTGKLLSPNPTIREINDAMSSILSTNYSREFIKKMWNTRFNAAVNYSVFADLLKKI